MPDEGSEYAAYGTAGHTVSQWCREQGRSAHDFIGVKLKVDQFEFTVDAEMANAVDVFCRRVAQNPGVPLLEVRVHYERFVPGGFGTLDDGRVQPRVCRVTDLKLGEGVLVEAVDNSQLKLYALGLYEDFKWLWEFDEFILAIDQPRLNHYDEFKIKLPDLLHWAETVVAPTAAIALKPGAPLKAGAHCQFCPAKKVCKVRAQWVINTVTGDAWGNLDSPQQLPFLTADEIAELLPKLPGAKKWIGDIESYALTQARLGTKFKGHKVVAGRSSRSYSVPEEQVVAALKPRLGEKLYTKPELISVAQAETELGGKTKAVAAILEPITKKTPGAPALMPEDDKRSELPPETSVSEFENLDAESA
jgi:hypothetical protein